VGAIQEHRRYVGQRSRLDRGLYTQIELLVGGAILLVFKHYVQTGQECNDRNKHTSLVVYLVFNPRRDFPHFG